MMGFDELSRRRRARDQRQRMEEELQRRRNQRDIDQGRRRVQGLIDDFTAKAVEAEGAGRHAQAVRFAVEAKRLAQYQHASGILGAKLETAQAMNAAGRAMTDVMSASGRLMETAARMGDPAALGELQAGMMAVNENLQMMLEQNDMLFDAADDGACEPDEAGERCLRELMDGARREKRDRLLRDTDRQLDRLQRARAAEK